MHSEEIKVVLQVGRNEEGGRTSQRGEGIMLKMDLVRGTCHFLGFHLCVVGWAEWSGPYLKGGSGCMRPPRRKLLPSKMLELDRPYDGPALFLPFSAFSSPRQPATISSFTMLLFLCLNYISYNKLACPPTSHKAYESRVLTRWQFRLTAHLNSQPHCS